MKLREYLAAQAAGLCLYFAAVVMWGVFAYFVGANAALLWGSVGALVAAAFVKCALGFLFARRRLDRLAAIKDGLSEKYLLGEILPEPFGAVEREYFEIMKEVSRSAVGAVEDVKRDKEEYFGTVEKWVHEIKTPLTACSLICDNGGGADKLRRELKKADNLTDTVLQYARLRSAERDAAIAEASASVLMNDAVMSQREILTAAKISVAVDGDFITHTDGKAVRFMLKQLLINCAKYCVGCRIEMTAADGKITVSDNGAGIAAHDLPRVFDRGFTGARGRNGGTGMGLYIVSELCKRLGIELSVSSREGEGTAFVFEFPQYSDACQKR